MIAFVAAAALLTQTQVAEPVRSAASLDSLRRVVDSIQTDVAARRKAHREARKRGEGPEEFELDSATSAHLKATRAAVDSVRRALKHVPVTPALLATAFKTEAARSLYRRAQDTRLRHDSSLQSYDATTYARVSVGLGFAKIGRDRVLFRNESATRVRWKRGVGAWVDVTGARSVVPALEGMGDINMDFDEIMSPIPYYPGRDAMWIGSDIAKESVDESDLIHPLARGAEAYYQYAIGDSMAFRLQDGRAIRLIELEFRARRPQWNLSVGSLWFDLDQAQLVRAAYRLSETMDIWKVAEDEDPDAFEDVPALIKPMLTPMQAEVSAISIEYGLHEGRFWLPRAQYAEGRARVGIMRVPFRIEERFKYASVNATDSLPAIPARVGSGVEGDSATDEASENSVQIGIGAPTQKSDTGKKQTARERQCAQSDTYQRTSGRYDDALRVAVRVPCDRAALARSPDLPPSIYDSGEQLLGNAELAALIEESLSLGDQSVFAPQRPTLHWGLDLLRYNRVEGLSGAISGTQSLGAGYTARALARIGLADLQPNGEFSLARSNVRRTVRVTAYRRLDVANDWGNPLGFGASVNALLLGADEGFYYRSWGAEFAGIGGEGSNPTFNWRFFGERHDAASVETNISAARAIGGRRFRDNIVAEEGTYVGSAIRLNASSGEDPHALRTLSDLRLEGATGPNTYVRAAGDLTLSHGLGPWMDGAVTLGAGRSAGTLPVQRLWYLGGSQSVRGQPAGAMRGDAYWLGHLELGTSFVGARPIVFADFGWAGDRRDWAHPGQPLSGAGAGVSIMDGLFRFDVAKGINPVRGWRGMLYVEARF